MSGVLSQILLRAIGEKSARAVRRALLAFAGLALLVLAMGFASEALVDALASAMPRYLALCAIAAALLIVGAVCLMAANSRPPAPPASRPPAEAVGAFSDGAPPDWKAALQLALAEDAQNRPARAAAMAALAGLILGALEGLNQMNGRNAE